MDRIQIEGLEIMAIIGVHDWEKTTPQKVLVDLELGVDTRVASGSDNIKDTAGYGDMARAVIKLVETSRYQLIESLAEAIAALLLAQFPVQWVTVKVGKPGAVKQARNVSVIIEREK